MLASHNDQASVVLVRGCSVSDSSSVESGLVQRRLAGHRYETVTRRQVSGTDSLGVDASAVGNGKQMGACPKQARLGLDAPDRGQDPLTTGRIGKPLVEVR
jgi:hypothetical protein